MLNPFNLIEKTFYKFRDFFWSYPDVIEKEGSFFLTFYRTFVPYSHFFVSTVVFILIVLLTFFSSPIVILNAADNTLIEGVVTGVDNRGALQRLSQVNPLIPSTVQIERDLVELIYEPLIKYEYNQSADMQFVPVVRNILADSVIRIRQGADYQFNLRRDIKWHDGRTFSADDVIQTFNLVSQLEEDTASIKAIKQLKWEKLDEFSVRVCTKGSDEQVACEATSDNPILSNFLELISIKILPAHKIADITARNITTSSPELFRSPVGTGKFKFFRADLTSAEVTTNRDYYETTLIPNIDSITFKFFKDLEAGIKSLQNGEIHSLASISTQFKKDLEDYPQISVNLSPVLDNQYWAIYFNLRKDPEGNSLGPVFFSDVKVRTAISYAINRQEIIENALQNTGVEVKGPIPEKSAFFNPNANWKGFNMAKANALLDEAGWKLKRGDKYRKNAKGEEMSFNLYFVNSFDRTNVAKVIKKDLEEVGVNAIIDRREQPGQDTSDDAADGWSLEEINNQFLKPRLFDAILYGMNTFIDPDRYELFHSSQEKAPGLNIAGYVGSVPSVKPRENRQEGESSLVTLPKVDRWLEEARSYNPETADKERKDKYNEFQALLAEDAPVTFLYHPQFLYYTNKSLKNINLVNVASVEDRFRNIEKVEIGE